jgi:hypothetical protein
MIVKGVDGGSSGSTQTINIEALPAKLSVFRG